MINILLSFKMAMILNSITFFGIIGEESKSPDTLVKMSGRVLNSQTHMPVKARIILERLPYSSNIIVHDSDGTTGDYKINVFNEIQYSIEVRAEGYSTFTDIISINEEDLTKDIFLVPSVVGQILRMNKLLFKQSTAQFYEDSFEELNSLHILLKENPTMVVQLEGHTDYRGNSKLNMKLSQDRVEAVKKYLINKGVNKNRIKIKAFGGTMPLSKEDSEEAQTMNRRVEVRILKK